MNENTKVGIEVQLSGVQQAQQQLKSLGNTFKDIGQKIATSISPKYALKQQIREIAKEIEEVQKEVEKRVNLSQKLPKKWLDLEKYRQQAEDSMKNTTDEGRKQQYSQKLAYINRLQQDNDKQEEENNDEMIKLSSRYDELIGKQNELIQMYADLYGEQEKSKKSLASFGSTIKNSLKTIKRFTLQLIGFRSAFSLFQKYRSIFMGFNEDLKYQSELSANAIANSLSPAFKFLQNIITRVSIGVAYFFDLLFDTNTLAQTMTMGVYNFNKQLKQTKTLVSGIDEITNLSSPMTQDIQDQYSAMEDFQKQVKEVKKTLDDLNIKELVEDLETIFKWVEKIWEKAKEVISDLNLDLGDIGKVILGFGAITIGFKLVGLAGVLGKSFVGLIGGEGVLGLASILKYIKDLGTITIKFGISFLILEGAKKTVKEMIKLGGKFEDELGARWTTFWTTMDRVALGGTSLKGYKNGLDYVPYDEYPAILHKGEAVVPSKYNPSVHSVGSEETNKLLSTLIVKMDNLSTRPNIFEIDGKKMATATYKYYQQEGNKRNNSMKIGVR